jgi:hypothetical protein
VCACGAALAFELQLTPNLVNCLEFAAGPGSTLRPEQMPAVTIEFSAVDVYSCPQVCRQGVLVEEGVVLQPAL